ncbi:MAG TPA: TraR/DksA C4-type zinc finger protein [Candidatus Paceibacterota bacterium]|jgi:RNA polymerase-binding transcription factor DksA|nr:TraR/DksA C4-type zinc finger protein [Candidatus Paceibacterota bacterium]
MNKRDTEKFKKLLQTEFAQLEEELNGIGQKSSSAPGGWEVTTGDMKVDTADDNEMADKFEELEDNAGIANKLEGQLNEVKAALERIEKGTYGICETCGKPIEIERLEANPSARVSIKHAH